MTRSKQIQGITTALAAVILASMIPGVAFAQSGREDRRRDQRTEQRQDRERSPRQRQDSDTSRNREVRNQRNDNNGRRGDERDQERDLRWRQNQERDRDRDRDRDRERDKDWDRNRDNRRGSDSDWNRDRDWNRDSGRDNRRDEDWNSGDNRRWDSDEAENRQKTKNEWRNLAIAAGGVAVYGLLKNDPTIVFAGAVGALYSLDRYEKDRKSQSDADRVRASLFSQPYIYRDGQRYDRCIITRNGERFYRFEKP